jgi:hypothetical protein
MFTSYTQDRSAYLAAAKEADPILGIYKSLAQIHECGHREIEHYNSVLEIMRPYSFISGNK